MPLEIHSNLMHALGFSVPVNDCPFLVAAFDKEKHLRETTANVVEQAFRNAIP